MRRKTKVKVFPPDFKPFAPPSSKLTCAVCNVASPGGTAPKYKCPKCRILYCSVACCKEHKRTCPGAVPTFQRKLVPGLGSMTRPSKYLPSDRLTVDPHTESRKRRQNLHEDEDYDEDDREGWRITREMMDRVDGSQWLKSELADGGLRQLIYDIDFADEKEEVGKTTNTKRKRNRMGIIPEMTAREVALEKAKLSNGKFATFLDKLLLEAGVLKKNTTGETEEEAVLSSLLHPEENLGPLSLVPIAKKKRKIEDSPADQTKREKKDGVSSSEGEEEDDSSSSSSDDESTTDCSSSSSD